MKLITKSLCIALIFHSFHAFALSDRVSKIDSLMNLFREYNHFNGAVLVSDSGKIIYKKAYGYANMEWKIPNTTQTRFKLASLGKQFTALLILQLVEEGKIKLDGKICDYLPEYPKKTGNIITIHQLLTHTSGIPNYHVIPDFDSIVSPANVSRENFIALFKSRDLLFPPGTQFAYSNLGYFLLGYIAERVTHKSFDVLIQEKIFIPAGMTNSNCESQKAIVGERAYGYKNAYVNYEPEKYRSPSTVFGAGHIMSTVEDFFKYDHALRNHTLLSEKYMDLIFTPYKENYGYGWFLTEYSIPPQDTSTLAYHDGGTSGFVTVAYRFIEKNNLVVVFSNVSPCNVYEIARGISRILFNKEEIHPKRSYVEQFAITTQKSGVQEAVKEFYYLKKTNPDSYQLDGVEFNLLGYSYMENQRMPEAIEVFKINVGEFPKTADPYDSLAEAYMKNGDKELAILNYKKSLELDPNNSNAKVMLKRLGVQ